MAAYEDEDGEPRYGQRLSPEELAVYLREQGIEPPATVRAEPSRPSPSDERGGLSGVRPALPGRVPSGASGQRGPTAWEDRPPRRRWRMLMVGLVLMIVVPLLMVGGAVGLVLDGSASSGAPLGEDGTVYLEAGTNAALYSSSLGGTLDQCTVSDPDGAEVALTDAVEGVAYAAFTATSTGTYTVSCPEGTASLVVGPPMDMSQVPLASALLLGGVLVGFVGLVVTTIGAVRLRPRRR